MVKIRIQRAGKTNRPFYRIVAAHSTRKRDGDFIEKLGTYNSLTKPASVELNEAKIIQWLKKGAQPTETVKSILRKQGIMHKFRLMMRNLPEEKIQTEMDNWKMRQDAKKKELEEKQRVKKTKAVKKKAEKPAEEAKA